MCVFKKSLYPLLFIFSILAGCEFGTKKKFSTIEGYDLNKPITVQLKSELAEISGIVYYPKDTSILANIDEGGNLYKIYLRRPPKIVRWKFSKKNDYEDLSLIDSTFFVLQSNGDIYSFKIYAKDSVVAQQAEFPFDGDNEFETLYYDENTKKLVLICKDCETDNRKSVTAYSYDPAANYFSDTPYFILDTKEVEQKLGIKKQKIKPSAAAIHPITKDLYILASVDKALIITDDKGKFKNAVELNPRVFKQPEGITFSPNGDLYISNEAAESGPPNIQLFKYERKS